MSGFCLAIKLRLFMVLALMTVLLSCAPTPDSERFTYDGVVSRSVVTGNTPTGSGGPRCGRYQADVGGKGSQISRAAGSRPRSYRVGPGDDLRLNIFGEEGMRDLIARVDAEGFIQLPIIESVKVDGLTTREIQARLKQAYTVSFVDPWVTVELSNAESHPIYFLGEFRDPGVKYMEFATDLVEALALAEGLEEDAFLPGARVIRRSTVCTVDLNALLKQGDFSQNIWMQAGDVVFAPLKEEMRVYVLGAVASPQAVSFGAKGRTMLEALSMAGGPVEASAALGQVRVVRSLSATRGELLIVDVQSMLVGEKLDFPLQPGDVVYVPRDGLGSWNEAISEILPSLELIGGVLTPFALLDSLQK